MSKIAETNKLELATELTVAWLSNPNTRVDAEEVPDFLSRMHQALGSMSEPETAPEAPAAAEVTPAVSVRKSLASKDYLISLIDGKPYKTLRRHLARHGLTPEQYRERYGLKRDYPMVSEAYSEVRRAMAKKIGLGRKSGESLASRAAPAASEAKPKRGRRARASS